MSYTTTTDFEGEDMQTPSRPRRRRGLSKFTAVLLIIIIVVAIAFIVSRKLALRAFPPVNTSDWQAIFLTNNQVYFGHLKYYNKEYVSLSNIFYLRAAEPLQQNSNPPGSSLQLVKLGSELHGPQDVMYIPNDKIMFWENLKSDSQVVQAIDGSLNQK